MPIEKVSNILKDADKNGYGAAAFNVYNYETIAWAIAAAEEEGVPIIIQYYPGFKNFMPVSTVAAITKDLAAKARVPIGLHLDHSISFEQAINGISCGFPSIMIDGSSYSFEENCKLTGDVVRAAHAMGVEVEAELGHVGSGSNIDDFTNSDHFTNVEAAVKFIEITGADSLAISIGNGHGQYVKTPSLDFKRLKEINDEVGVPLVLHGGSDTPDYQVQKAISLGINKINIATEYNRAFFYAFSDEKEKFKSNQSYMYGALNAVMPGVKEFLRNKIRMLNPKGYHI